MQSTHSELQSLVMLQYLQKDLRFPLRSWTYAEDQQRVIQRLMA